MAVEREEDEGEKERESPITRQQWVAEPRLACVTDWRAGWLSVCDAGSEASETADGWLLRRKRAAPGTVCLIAPAGGS